MAITLYKLSALVEKPTGNQYYTDIGHSGWGEYADNYEGVKTNEERMWVIMSDWSFKEADANEVSGLTGDVKSHSEALGFFEYQDNWIAKGRYEKSSRFPEGGSSLTFSFQYLMMEEQNPRRYEFAKNKVVKIIEDHYGAGVRITLFR